MNVWRRSTADFFEPPGHFGGLRLSDIVSKELGANFWIQESVAPPGAGGHSHHHEAEAQLFMVIKGELTFDTGSDRFTLRDGEAVLFQPFEPHATVNEGDEDSVSVVVTVTVDGPGHSR
ncbi:MAG: cupin domain-containing protein [Acidimicrobiia bacterium]